VGYIVWPQRVGSRKNPGMLSQYLVCPEVAISRRIHLWEGKSASNQPCENSNASPDLCGQEPCVLVALRWKGRCCDRGIFPRTRLPAVGYPGRGSRRPGLGWCWRSIGERRNWLFTLDRTAVQGCMMFPRSQGSQRQEMFCCYPSWRVAGWSHQRTDWGVGTSWWPLVWITSVEVCRG